MDDNYFTPWEEGLLGIIRRDFFPSETIPGMLYHEEVRRKLFLLLTKLMEDSQDVELSDAVLRLKSKVENYTI